MALTLRVSGDFEAARRALARYTPEAMVKAAQPALNKTAEQGRTEARLEMPRVFDRPTPYAMAAVRIVPARGQALQAEVTLHGSPGASGVSGHKFLGPEIAGGQRRDKGSERRLKKAGLLPDGMQTTPGQGADLDAYGNLSRSLLMQILAWFQTYREKGKERLNLSEKARAKRIKGTRRKYGYEFFIMPAGGKWPSGRPAAPGVYRRTFIGEGLRGGAVTAVDPMLMFVRAAGYRPRYEFPQIVERVVKRDFPGNLSDQLRSVK